MSTVDNAAKQCLEMVHKAHTEAILSKQKEKSNERETHRLPSERANTSSIMSIRNLITGETDISSPGEQSGSNQSESADGKPQKFLCLTCNVVVAATYQAGHQKTIKHQKALGVVDPVGPLLPKRFCEVCQMSINVKSWKRHEQALSHQALMGVLDPVQPKMRLCEYCGFGVRFDHWTTHKKSARHRKATGQLDTELEELPTAAAQGSDSAPINP
ncbi:uncharacterized protein N0V89_006060 [Didymosphaeria variabile]|uniref:Uncharacterized protein n=1 Tax=Didymosphaeria variabile TaxID=1932322 RepID=A0A9W8XLV9_9PLEO|nr:uncharacterized protein N0V89_006060 [Didymosphaeria variabile]KAJ4354325.1 hypothetical protein N0V89_006060 [Didymosphaeria variabile]